MYAKNVRFLLVLAILASILLGTLPNETANAADTENNIVQYKVSCFYHWGINIDISSDQYPLFYTWANETGVLDSEPLHPGDNYIPERDAEFFMLQSPYQTSWEVEQDSCRRWYNLQDTDGWNSATWAKTPSVDTNITNGQPTLIISGTVVSYPADLWASIRPASEEKIFFLHAPAPASWGGSDARAVLVGGTTDVRTYRGIDFTWGQTYTVTFEKGDVEAPFTYTTAIEVVTITMPLTPTASPTPTITMSQIGSQLIFTATESLSTTFPVLWGISGVISDTPGVVLFDGLTATVMIPEGGVSVWFSPEGYQVDSTLEKITEGGWYGLREIFPESCDISDWHENEPLLGSQLAINCGFGGGQIEVSFDNGATWQWKKDLAPGHNFFQTYGWTQFRIIAPPGRLLYQNDQSEQWNFDGNQWVRRIYLLFAPLIIR
jgi:hypothetical protein